MLYIREEGPKTAPLIVHLHGFLGSHHDFLPIANNLKDRFLCALVDLPAHGNSSSLPLDSFEVFLAWLIKGLKKYKGREIHWVGYSLGGRLLSFLLNQFNTKSVVWISAKLLPLSAEQEIDRLQFEKKICKLFDEETFGNFLKKWYDQPLFQTIKKTPELYQTLLMKRLKQSPQLMRDVFTLTSPLTIPSVSKEIKSLSIPMLYCTGAEDQKYVQEAKALNKSMAMRIKIFPQASHLVHLEKPELFSQTLSHFLEEHL